MFLLIKPLSDIRSKILTSAYFLKIIAYSETGLMKGG